jgi:hypothetical protein
MLRFGQAAFALFCAACSVDNRTLLGSATSGDFNADGGMSFVNDPGHGSDAASGGEGGEVVLPRCRYSGAVEAGCDTLVDNPGFAMNVAGWTAEPVGMLEAWASDDANGDKASGSLLVTNFNYSDEASAKDGTAGGGARQCLAVTGGRRYDLTADIFVQKGQGDGLDGGTFSSVATLSVFFYQAADCQGPTHGNFTSAPVDTTNEWVHVEGSAQAPKDGKSMAVRLATLKPFPQYKFQAEFDNVFVRQR